MIEFRNEDERAAWDRYAAEALGPTLVHVASPEDVSKAPMVAAATAALFADAMLEERRKRRIAPRPKPTPHVPFSDIRGER